MFSNHPLLRLAPLALALFACNPQVPLPHRPPPAPTRAEEVRVEVAVEPSAPLDTAPRVLRLRVTAAGSDIEPAQVALVHGDISAAQLRALARGEISAALAKRLVPTIVFREEAGEEDASTMPALIVAPTVALTPAERYVLAIGEPEATVELRVASSDPAPLLGRIWPREGASATGSFGVWCGEATLAELNEPVQLSPEGARGWLRRGALAGDPGQRCLRFEAPPDATGDGGVPPPVVPHREALGRLDPRPLTADAEAQPITPLVCAPDELAFGPGCVKVFDDRLVGRSPDAPALWTIQGESIDQVFATPARAPFVVTSLQPDRVVALQVAAIDNRGAAENAVFSAATRLPMAHVVLNEVLANPIGPEPAQEWVELVNDGSVPAELGGYVLVDVGGETPLPAATLLPGDFALIVNESFAEDDEYDPPPAPSALVLRVPELGRSGLSNSGEPLKLRGPDGAVVSRFSASLGVKAGMSVARRTPASPDALPEGFVVASPTPGRPNEP